MVVGECPACKAAGRKANLVAQKNPRTLKRFIHCENYDECGTGYPLPQYGKLEATGEVCEHCGAPIVVVTTARGPWRLCPNFDCPGKEQDGEEKAGEKASARGRRAASTKKGAPRRGRGKRRARRLPGSPSPSLRRPLGPSVRLRPGRGFSPRRAVLFSGAPAPSPLLRVRARPLAGALAGWRSAESAKPPSLAVVFTFLAAFASSLRLFSGLPERVSSSVARSRRRPCSRHLSARRRHAAAGPSGPLAAHLASGASFAEPSPLLFPSSLPSLITPHSIRQNAQTPLGGVDASLW